MINRFGLGVFVDAHHLCAVDARNRRAVWVLDQIERAAERLCMASGISHRVVVADCSDPDARRIAEDFGDHGFRIRHVPRRRAQVLGAEVLEAVNDRPHMLAAAVVADQDTYLPLADPLHRTGRALIACSVSAVTATSSIDDLIQIPLGGEAFVNLIRTALRTLAAEQNTQVSLTDVEKALRRVQPGFTAAAYRVQTRRILATMKDPWFSFQGDRIHIHDGAAGNSLGPVAAPAAAFGHVPLETVRQACRSVAANGVSDPGSAVAVFQAVLEALLLEPEARASVATGGVRLTDLGQALKAVPFYKTDLKTKEVAEKASQGTAWYVWRNPDRAPDVRLRFDPAAEQTEVRSGPDAP